MKRICFLSGDITRTGGTERAVAHIANALKKNGKYEIHILSLAQKNRKNFFNFDADISFSTIFKSPRINYRKKYFCCILGIRKYIKIQKIDVIIDVDTILEVFTIPASRFIQTKVISWEHFNYYENLGSNLRVIGRKLAARYSNAIVTITKEDLYYFKDNLKPKTPVYSIYNPIEIQKKQAEYNINSKRIISVGRLTYQKGFDMLIDIAELVLKNHLDWKWIVYGEGEDRLFLENKIKEKKLYGRVLLVGNVRNMDMCYKESSFFVLTSRYEGFGLVLTEAKAYKLPCVSFRCRAGPSEIILDGVNGYLIDCFSINDMANRIDNLILDTSLRRKFSNNSLLDTEKFNLECITNQWVDLLDNI